MERRKFIASTSLIATLSLLDPLLTKSVSRKEQLAIPIVDTHQHLWDIKRFSEGWSKPPLARNFDTSDYLEAISGLNVIKSVYMEVAVPPGKRHEEALYAIEVCRDKNNPTVAAVIAVDPNRIDFREYFKEFEKIRFIKGIRYFFKSGEEMISEQVIRNINHLGTIGRSFDIVVPPEWLGSAQLLIKACPYTRFIIDHCGNVDPKAFLNPPQGVFANTVGNGEKWKKDMAYIAEHKNVFCKISGIVSKMPGFNFKPADISPIIDHCLKVFGPERAMFAGDWPVCLKNMSLADWVNILKEVLKTRSYTEKKKIFHDNATKFYDI